MRATIAVVLARLVGAAVEDLVDRRPISARVPLHQRFDRRRPQIIGTHRRQDAAEAANRRSDVIADEGFRHRRTPALPPKSLKITSRLRITMLPAVADLGEGELFYGDAHIGEFTVRPSRPSFATISDAPVAASMPGTTIHSNVQAEPERSPS